jgi:tetratricopeptide (TPR) repeat protein
VTVELLESTSKNQNAFAKAVGNSSLGSYLIRTGEIEKGIVQLKEAEVYFNKRSDYVLLSETRNEIGHAYYLSGSYNEAIKAYLTSIKSGKKATSDPTARFNGMLGLGRSYIAVGDTAVGVYTILDYKKQSIKYSKYEAAADAYAYLGMVEMGRGKNDLSREYYEKSILYSEKSDSKIHISHAYNNKAILHFNIGETDSSLLYFEQALRLRERINHVKGIIESYYNIGFLYEETGDFHNAYLYYTKSTEIARMHNIRADELDALFKLKEICSQLGYTTELERNAVKIDSLQELISEKDEFDEEIVAYAERVLNELNVKETPQESTSRSMFYLWVIPGFILLIGFAVFRKRRV